MEDLDQHFQSFASLLERTIAGHGHGKTDRVEAKRQQAQQIRELLEVEEAFRAAVTASASGFDVWRGFLEFIASRASVSQAQPYFRERQVVFIGAISPLLKEANVDELLLQPFRINRGWIEFALGAVEWGDDHPVRALAARAAVLRRELVELNLPLAVSRARIFWSRNAHRPGAKLTFMDFVQIAAQGLLVAVDKFTPTGDPDTEPELFAKTCDVFPSVAITRMSGFFIQSYSETQIHFSSSDRRRLYRLKKMLSKRGVSEVNIQDLVDEVNRGVEDPARWVTAEDVEALLAASTVGSTDATRTSEDDGFARPVHEGVVPESDQPDAAADAIACRGRMALAVAELPLRQKKILRMYGMEVQA